MNPSPEIEAVVRRFLAARQAADVEAMLNLHSRSEYSRLIGTDRHEWFLGYDRVVGAWRGALEEFDSVVLPDSKLLRLEAFESGKVGWAAVEQQRTLTGGDTFIWRITMVLEIEAGAWKVAQIHFSLPVANRTVFGKDLSTGLSDLLTSMDNEAAASALGEVLLGTVTILFTDIVDSTPLSKSMGDRTWSDTMTSHFDSVRETVEREGGTVVKTLGDGGMYVFSSGASALLAAANTQRTVASGEGRVKLRMGVHTGDVVRTANDYLGSTVNKAARVAAASEGEQILVSSTTYDMVDTSEFMFGEPLTAELKGIEGTHTLWPLLWDRA